MVYFEVLKGDVDATLSFLDLLARTKMIRDKCVLMAAFVNALVFFKVLRGNIDAPRSSFDREFV